MLDILRAKARADREAVGQASLNRIFSMRGTNDSFALLTSWRDLLDRAANLARFERLKHDIRSLDLGFFRLPAHSNGSPTQPWLFVPGLSLRHAKRIRVKYGQDAVVYSGPETDGHVGLLDDGGLEGMGPVTLSLIATVCSKITRCAVSFEYSVQSWVENLVADQIDPGSGGLQNVIDVVA